MSRRLRTNLFIVLLCIFCTAALPVGAQQARGRGAQQSVVMKIRARAGDTLASLSSRFNFPVSLLERLNGRNPEELLPVGLEIYLPSKGSQLMKAEAAQPSRVYQLLPPGEFPTNGTKDERFRFLYPYILQAAQTNGVDPYLLTTVCDIETTFQPLLTSPKGAMGLTQLMPKTAANFGVTNAYDFRQALEGGAKYLRVLSRLFDGDLDLILAGYNAGEGNVIKYGRRVPPFKETLGYVARGHAAYLRYSQGQVSGQYQEMLANNLHLTSYSQSSPASVAPAPEEAAQDEPAQDTRSIVYGEEKMTATEKEKENSPQPETRVTRSIKFQ